MEIKVRIKPDGEVELMVNGVQGKACMQLTEFLEKSLGEVVEREYTAEYYAQAPAKQTLPQFVDRE